MIIYVVFVIGELIVTDNAFSLILLLVLGILFFIDDDFHTLYYTDI